MTKKELIDQIDDLCCRSEYVGTASHETFSREFFFRKRDELNRDIKSLYARILAEDVSE